MLDRVEYLIGLLQQKYLLERIDKSTCMKLTRTEKERLAEVQQEASDIIKKLGGSEKRELKVRAKELGMEKLV